MIYNFDDLYFKIFSVDYYTHKQGFYEVKERPYAAFSFRVEGSGAFRIGDKRFVSKKENILFVPANTPYEVEYSDGKSIVVHFMHCNYLEAENICLDNCAEIELLFSKLLESWKSQHSVNRAKSIIYKIFEKIEKQKTIANKNSPFATCVKYMENNFCNPKLDIPEVCKAGFISVSSLQRAFNEHFDLSPKQYLLNLRMNHALELLAENEISIKEIAFACGFNDEKYFSKVFKNKYGYPPSHTPKILNII